MQQKRYYLPGTTYRASVQCTARVAAGRRKAGLINLHYRMRTTPAQLATFDLAPGTVPEHMGWCAVVGNLTVHNGRHSCATTAITCLPVCYVH